MAEAEDLKSFQCGFESRLPYQPHNRADSLVVEGRFWENVRLLRDLFAPELDAADRLRGSFRDG